MDWADKRTMLSIFQIMKQKRGPLEIFWMIQKHVAWWYSFNTRRKRKEYSNKTIRIVLSPILRLSRWFAICTSGSVAVSHCHNVAIPISVNIFSSPISFFVVNLSLKMTAWIKKNFPDPVSYFENPLRPFWIENTLLTKIPCRLL